MSIPMPSVAAVPFVPSAARVISLRAAALRDDRELALGRALSAAGAALAEGRVVELIWPASREAAWASAALGLPLAQSVAALAASAPAGGAVVIHTRTGSPDDFLALAPHPRISFVVHTNAEEAALRWERGDASPGRRVAAAARLRAAGWQVWLCVGPVRLYDGWREEYEDLAERATAAGFRRLLVSFPGEDAMEPVDSAAPGGDGVRPVLTARGCRFTVPPHQRREVQALLNARLAAGRETRERAAA